MVPGHQPDGITFFFGLEQKTQMFDDCQFASPLQMIIIIVYFDPRRLY